MLNAAADKSNDQGSAQGSVQIRTLVRVLDEDTALAPIWNCQTRGVQARRDCRRPRSQRTGTGSCVERNMDTASPERAERVADKHERPERCEYRRLLHYQSLSVSPSTCTYTRHPCFLSTALHPHPHSRTSLTPHPLTFP